MIGKLFVILLGIFNVIYAVNTATASSIYDNLKINSINITDTSKTFGYQSPFIKVNTKYKLFNMDFEYTKTLHFFGDCNYLPFPLRVCARTYLDENSELKAGLYFDNTDVNDHNVYFQPFNVNQKFDDNGLMRTYKASGIYPSYISSKFDVMKNLKFLAKTLEYWEKNGKDKTYNTSATLFGVLSNFKFPIRPAYVNYSPNYEDNTIFPTILLEKYCDFNQFYKISEPCLPMSTKSSFTKVGVRITVVNAFNTIPMCDYIRSSDLGNCFTYVAGNNPSNMALTLPVCSENNSSVECLHYEGKGEAPSGTFNILYTSYIAKDKFEKPGIEQITTKRLGAIRNTNSLELLLDLSASFPFSTNMNFIDMNGKLASVTIKADYNKNDRYICFTAQYKGSEQAIGCIERPSMDMPKIEACSTSKGCVNNFSKDDPSIILTYGNNYKTIIKAGEKKTLLNWEFANIPLDTANKQVSLDNNGVYNKTANKVCLWGYQTFNPKTITKKEPVVVKVSSADINIDAPIFWSDGFVSNIVGNTETIEDLVSAGYNPSRHIVTSPLPLHDNSLNLCLDIPSAPPPIQ